MSESTTATIDMDETALNQNIKQYVTMKIADQLVGIDVMNVRDVIRSQNITPIPLAPREIEGAFNLRGRVVTAINVRERLGIDSENFDKSNMMNVVIENDGELFSLMVDVVGDVLGLNFNDFGPVPGNLDPIWKEFASGIYRLKNEILVVLSKETMLNFRGEK